MEAQTSGCWEELTNAGVRPSWLLQRSPELGLNSTQLLLMALEAANPRSRCQQGWFPSVCTQSELWSLLFLEGHRYHPGLTLRTSSDPSHLLEAQLLIPSHWGIGLQHTPLGGTKTS